MSARRRWLALLVVVAVAGIAGTWYWLPDIVRHVAVSRIRALTNRTASIERVDVSLLSGRVVVTGFRLTDRDGRTPFADFAELDLRVRLPSLLFGHLWIRDLVLKDSTVRVVRLDADRFNLSDLIGGSGASGASGDVTVDRFELVNGTVTLEDRAVPEPTTWRSENITISGRHLSTRRNDGTAVATSVTAGAPVRVELRDLRLRPIHLNGNVTVSGLDLALARVYLPPDAPVVLERGRTSTSIAVTLDARDGLRVDGTGRLEDVALVRRGGDRLAVVPRLETTVRGFAVRDGAFRVEQLSADGTMSVRDPAGKAFRLDSVRASVSDLTWPATTPGRIDVQTSIPGGGTLAVTGTVRAPPDPTDLRVRLANLDLAPWAWLVPLSAHVTGVAEADLRVNEPLGAGIPTRVQGSIAVNRLGVSDGRQQFVGAQRIEAGGLEVHWPTRVVARTVTVSAPRGVVERDRAGDFPARRLLAAPARPASTPTPPSSASPLAVEIGEVVVRDGAVTWRDQAVASPVQLTLSRIDARVTGLGWPLRGAAGVRASLAPPGGGELRVSGQVGVVDPMNADLRLVARGAALAPYQPYLATPARVTGATDFDLAVVVPSLAEPRATARGTLALSRLDVHDRQRTLVRLERGTATGVEIDWPRRIDVARVVLVQPWAVIERDDSGALPLRALLAPATGGSANGTAENGGGEPLAVTVAETRVDGGGLRLVDRAVAPAFAVDFQPVTLRAAGLTTVPGAKPARVDVSGQLGPGAMLDLRGTLGTLGAPLRLDVNGELRDFALPRTNPYLLRQIGWKTAEGRLSTKVRCKIDGDALSARTDVRLSRLELIRAASDDGAQARLGLPLRMLTSLMKDKRGDITLSFPIGGRVSDPRFDFSEAMWSAIRTVATNAIALPVSWIGRVRYTPDSRIDRIEVDPIAFEPGTPALTAAGQTQVGRLAAFFEQLPEVKMALTPVVSASDLASLRRRAVEAELERLARDERLSREAAAARLYEQRLRGRQMPATVDATIAALAEHEPTPTPAVTELAARRVDALRTPLKQAGVDPDRLIERSAVERDASRVELEVVDPDTPRPSRTREMLRRVGVPVKPEKH